MPIISLNNCNSKDLLDPGFKEIGIPFCPNDPSLSIVYWAICIEHVDQIELNIFSLNLKN